MKLIYTLSDSNGQVRYIGKTQRSIEVRKNEHIHLAKKSKIYLYCWIRSLKSFPEMKVLEECKTLEELNAAEVKWIKHFREMGCPLTNLTEGGEGQVGFRHSEETKTFLSRLAKGQPKPKSKENIKKAHEYNKGKSSPASKITVTLATAANKGRKQPIEEYLHRCKPVLETSTGKIYQSVTDAALAIGASRTGIRRNLNGAFKTIRGHSFQWLQTQSSVSAKD